MTFDPLQVSHGQLVKVFFSVAHDPTGLNRQGPDTVINDLPKVANLQRQFPDLYVVRPSSGQQ